MTPMAFGKSKRTETESDPVDEQPEAAAIVSLDREQQQCPSGFQRTANVIIFAGLGNDFVGQVGDEIVDLVIIGAIRTPDTLTLGIVKTETLCARHKRMQQTFGLANVFSCLQVVQVSRQHWLRYYMAMFE